VRPKITVRRCAARSQIRCHNGSRFKDLPALRAPPSPPFLDTHNKSAIRKKYLTHEGRIPDAILIAGRGRCLRAASQAVPGRLRASCPPVLRPVRGVLPLDWDRRKAGNAAAGRVPGNLSQATWPEVEKPRPRNFGQSRGGAPRGERARGGRSVQTDFPWRAPRPKRERVATAVGVARSIFSLRLPALRLPSFYLEAKQQWLSFLLQNSGADAPRGRERLLHLSPRAGRA
jgi:hypothetical protein